MSFDFVPFEHNVFIPSIGEDFKVRYTEIDKELLNAAVISGWMSSPNDTED